MLKSWYPFTIPSSAKKNSCIKIFILQVLPLFLTCAAAAPHAALYGGLAVLGPAYNAPLLPVEAAKIEPPPQGSVSYSVSNVQTPTGEVKQQTAIGKDARGGHTIRHSAQTSNLDPHSGQSDFKHDEHEFHINPFIGEAAVHTNNAQGSLNPTLGECKMLLFSFPNLK